MWSEALEGTHALLGAWVPLRSTGQPNGSKIISGMFRGVSGLVESNKIVFFRFINTCKLI